MFLVRISFCILLLSHCSVSLAQDRVKDLAQNPQWLALLHYASASFRSDRSLVDDSKFF
ncbi:MAG: hypothetical protein R3A13_05920 [Bdellovibrionota bacterium]